MVEGADGLLERRETIRAMGIDYVHVGEGETRQRGGGAFEDVFAGETVVVYEDFAVGGAPVELNDGVRGVGERGKSRELTLVLMTRSLRFQPYFLMASPIIISDCPPA